MEDQQDALPANNRAVKLPPFWTANPRAWFASAEWAFQLRNIADERSRFFNCLHALPEATVCLIADLVEADPLPENPYTELRRRLLAAHQLTDIQRVEQLFNLPVSEAVGAVGGDATALSQGPGEQRLLQLLVSQQAA